jgi:hypothetical protein
MSSQSFMNMESIKKSISAIDISERPDFMTPKPRSPKKKTPAPRPEIESILGKRKYKDAFEEATFDDERYDQHIAIDFFETNTGHNVIQQANMSAFQRATDQVIEDFRRDFQTAIPILRRDRDSESKYDQEELLAWCEYYLANRNLFNV